VVDGRIRTSCGQANVVVASRGLHCVHGAVDQPKSNSSY
jgi:hypothetical protein